MPELKVIIGGDGERAQEAAEAEKGDEMRLCGGAEERSTRGDERRLAGGAGTRGRHPGG